MSPRDSMAVHTPLQRAMLGLRARGRAHNPRHVEGTPAKPRLRCCCLRHAGVGAWAGESTRVMGADFEREGDRREHTRA